MKNERVKGSRKTLRIRPGTIKTIMEERDFFLPKIGEEPNKRNFINRA